MNINYKILRIKITFKVSSTISTNEYNIFKLPTTKQLTNFDYLVDIKFQTQNGQNVYIFIKTAFIR